MIQRFHAVNYKGLQMDPLEFGAVNLFIGPNNSGKSNFFGALSFLFDMFGRPEEARGTLEAALRRRANGPLLSRGTVGEVRLEWGFGSAEGNGSYEVSLVPSEGGGSLICREAVRLRFGKESPSVYPYFRLVMEDGELRMTDLEDGHELMKHRLNASSLEDSLFRRRIFGRDETRDSRPTSADAEILPNLQGATLWTLGQLASSSHHFRASTFVPSDAAAPQRVVRARMLDERGLLLVNLLHSFLHQNGFKRSIVGELTPLLPGLDDLKVGETSGYRWLQLKIRGEWLNLSELSDGTITALALATLLFSPVKSGTLCLDEPELNLHPAWARTVASWVLRQSSWEQVMLCTHSPEVLDPFTEHFRSGEVRLFVFQRTEQGFQLRHCPPDRLEAHLQEGWLLGDLYRIGEPALGGWPW